MGMRFKKVSDVNRQLHGAIVKKKKASEELHDKIRALEKKMEAGKLVELPAREARMLELDILIKDEQRKQQSANLELGRNIMEREERASELTSVNATLREKSTAN